MALLEQGNATKLALLWFDHLIVNNMVAYLMNQINSAYS